MEMQELTLEKFEEASEIVSKVTQETKLIFSEYFSEISGNKVYFKPENMQKTGAYKVRGAFYKISQLSDEEPRQQMARRPRRRVEQRRKNRQESANCRLTGV